MDTHELGRFIIEMATRKGADEAEVFIKEGRGTSVEVKDGQVEALEASRDLGLSLRVIKNGRLGFSFSSSVDDVENTVDKALLASENTAHDGFNGLPDASDSPDVEIYDKAIAGLTEDDIIKAATELEKSALEYDDRIRKVRKSEVGAATGRTLIMNSRGIDSLYSGSYYSAHTTVIAEDGSGESQMGWDYASSRRLSDVDVRNVGMTAAKRAIELMGSRKMKPLKAPVILADHVAVDFLEILSSSLSAESVQKGRSFMVGKTGKAVISRLINIVDDGTLAWGAGTSPVDDEGVPSSRKVLIEEGVLKGFIHNTYTAKKGGTTSTGNAVRSGAMSLPGVDVTNCYIETGGTKTRDELAASLSRGMIILNTMGVHTADPISGDFSIGISGMWVENGIENYPVKEAVISGNILEMFRKVEEVGGDLRFYGSMGSPSLLIGEMDISA